MKPLKRMNLKDIVIEKLHKLIAERQLEPGDRFLNEKEIIELTGVSRTVVREALKAMEAVGVLRIKPGDGNFIHEASVDHLVSQFSFRWMRSRSRMLELLETRLMLEQAAIELIAVRLNEDPSGIDFRALDDRLTRMEKAIERRQSIVEEDIEFHRTLFALTGNRTFCELSEIITQYFDEIRAGRMSLADGYGETLNEHAQIVRHLKNKNADGAKLVMAKHLSPLKKIIAEGQY